MENTEYIQRLVRAETQISRLISHIESERGTFTRFEQMLATRHEDHENRIRHLERWAWGAIGALALVMLVKEFIT